MLHNIEPYAVIAVTKVCQNFSETHKLFKSFELKWNDMSHRIPINSRKESD